jgi:hypothetical protein
VEVLEKIQRRAVNMVAGLKGSTYEKKLEELDMLTLEERRHQADMVQVYKILHGRDNVDKNQCGGKQHSYKASDGSPKLSQTQI